MVLEGGQEKLLLDIDNLSVSYRSVLAINKINISVSGGELVGLIGPNGSGKSTLIRAVSGVITKDSGDVYLFGEKSESFSQRQLALRIGVVSQASVLPDDFTAIEVVLLGRTPNISLLGLESKLDLQIVKNAMLRTGTWSLANRKIVELSGGQRQMVRIARVLAQESPIVLLDEPTVHLDINF